MLPQIIIHIHLKNIKILYLTNFLICITIFLYIFEVIFTNFPPPPAVMGSKKCSV